MINIEVMRATAARARREAIEDTSPAGIQRARAAAPLDVGRARRVFVPTELQTSLHKRNCNGSGDDCVCGSNGNQSLFSRTPAELASDGLWHHLSGTASLTETAYEMWDLFGPYIESVRSTAFSKSLSSKPDVAFLVNHTGLTMARTINGSLQLSDPLEVQAWLNPARSDVNDLVAAIKDGDINQMSFAAMLEQGEWNDDYTRFTMTELDLHCGDVSAVNFGANPYTSISARAHRIIDEMDRLPSGAARAAMRHLQDRFDVDADGGNGGNRMRRAAAAPAPTETDGVTEQQPAAVQAPAEVAMGRSINLVRTTLLADDE
jgi:hypothetical protein